MNIQNSTQQITFAANEPTSDFYYHEKNQFSKPKFIFLISNNLASNDHSNDFFEPLDFDCFNYLGIKVLEKIGLSAPSQAQIELAESLLLLNNYY